MKSKQSQPAPARDLYTSPLFRGQRTFVERSCDEWFILSAEYGLVDPDTVLAPYEKTLNNASVREKREWSRHVLESLAARFPQLDDTTFEVHAGANYLRFGVADAILGQGGKVESPVEGLPLGRRLAFYKVAGCL